MCEIRFYRCPCGTKWTAHKKLSSCESPDPAIRCPESLCMYVGNFRKPQKQECEPCRELREEFEALEDPSGDEAAGKVADGTGKVTDGTGKVTDGTGKVAKGTT